MLRCKWSTCSRNCPATIVIDEFGVQSQGSDRCAQPVSEVGHPLPFGIEQVLDPLRERVEGGGQFDRFRWATDPGSRRQLTLAQPVGGRRHGRDRRRHAPRELARQQGRTDDQQRPDRADRGDGGRHAPG